MTGSAGLFGGPAAASNDPPPLALRVLRALARLVTAVLLALDLARVARDEPGLLEGRPVLRVDLQQRTRDAVADRDRLCAHSTTEHVDVGAILARSRGDLERLPDDHARGLAPEILIGRAIVDYDLALTGSDHDAGDRRLALAGTPKHVGVCTHRVVSTLQASGTGFCARCGWSGPAYTLSFVASRRPSRFFGSMPSTASRMSRVGCRSRTSCAVAWRMPPG